MSDLVQRLGIGNHAIVSARTEDAKQLKQCIDRGFVLLKFTETQGGTELGIRLDESACDLGAADFERATGSVHLEGDLKLDYVPVRLVADLDISTLQGSGLLKTLASA